MIREATDGMGGINPMAASGLFVLENLSCQTHRTTAKSDVLMMGGIYCDDMEDLLLKLLQFRE